MINDELKKNPVPGTKNDKEPYVPKIRIHRKLVVDDQGRKRGQARMAPSLPARGMFFVFRGLQNQVVV